MEMRMGVVGINVIRFFSARKRDALYLIGTFLFLLISANVHAADKEQARKARTVRAELRKVDIEEVATGTVRSRHVVTLAAQVNAQVLAVHPQVGQLVRKGEQIIELDRSEIEARFNRAQAHYERIRRFLQSKAATQEQWEQAESEFAQAKALLGHTIIEAPLDGIVERRMVEPGDLAWAGRPLIVIFDPQALRLEARVREGLLNYVKRDQLLTVELPAINQRVEGKVAEVLPSVEPQTRTFDVWVNIEAREGIFPGMFGRLAFPAGSRQVISVPAAAVDQRGQLRTVLVQQDQQWVRRLVTVARKLPDGSLEVLSGLQAGEVVDLGNSEVENGR